MSKKIKTKGTSDDIDKHVGRQLRARRTLLDMSQEKLGGSVGVTFQQIQKYERGVNRISASRLFSFSKILGVNIDYFYVGVNSTNIESNVEESKNIKADVMVSKETITLVKAYYALNEDDRKAVIKFLRSLGSRKK